MKTITLTGAPVTTCT